MSDSGCGDPRCRVDYCRGSQTKAQSDSALTLRDRIAAAITGVRIQRDSDAHQMADAVIAELETDHAIVQLPECDPGTTDQWNNSTVHLGNVLPHYGLFLEIDRGEIQHLMTGEAREIAAALLAAARKADDE